jgi:Golgi apparatus protein 1
VHRVLRERAARVNLLPDVEENCRDALSEFCSHNVQPQEEMKCLQEAFEKPEFKQHYAKCYKELYKFTEMESKDTKLNRLLTRACRPVIETYCVVRFFDPIRIIVSLECQRSRNRSRRHSAMFSST